MRQTRNDQCVKCEKFRACYKEENLWFCSNCINEVEVEVMERYREKSDKLKELLPALRRNFKDRAVSAINIITTESPTWKFTDYNYSGADFKWIIRRKRNVPWLKDVAEHLERIIKQGGEHMCAAGGGNVSQYFVAYK